MVRSAGLLLVVLIHHAIDPCNAFTSRVVHASLLSKQRSLERFKEPSGCNTRIHKPTSTVPTTTTHLQASATIVTTAGLILAHVIGGSLGTPIVLRAIKTWYDAIDKPPWTPPNVVFAPVWTILYALMGFAVSRIVIVSSSIPWYRQTSLQLWMVHYGLNILWAPVFFGWKRFRLASVMNFGLLATLAATVYTWWSQAFQLSSLCMIPYALWLTYATVLNIEICRRNPGPYNSARFAVDLDRLQKDAAKNAGL